MNRYGALAGILLLGSSCCALGLIGAAYIGLVNAGMKPKSAGTLIVGVLLLIVVAVYGIVTRSAKSYEEE